MAEQIRNLDPLCNMEGCMHQRHFRTIRRLQAKVEALEGALKIALEEWKAWMDDADAGDFSGSDNDDRKAWSQAATELEAGDERPKPIPYGLEE